MSDQSESYRARLAVRRRILATIVRSVRSCEARTVAVCAAKSPQGSAASPATRRQAARALARRPVLRRVQAVRDWFATAGARLRDSSDRLQSWPKGRDDPRHATTRPFALLRLRGSCWWCVCFAECGGYLVRASRSQSTIPANGIPASFVSRRPWLSPLE